MVGKVITALGPRVLTVAPDSLLEGQRRALQFESVSARSLTNVRNWVDGKGCIARDETAYLGQPDDLLSVVSLVDHATSWMEALVEDGSIFFKRRLNGILSGTSASDRSVRLGPSRDPLVHILPSSALARSARVSVAVLITLMLLTPVVICHFLSSETGRLIVVVAATATFIGIVSGFSNARTIELIVTGAT